LGRLYQGQGLKTDLTLLGTLSSVMMDSSMCGLGQAAPVPVVDSLNYFRDIYESRVMNKDRSK
jgi:NADH:ubiquinone oxidoreductase subunit F (NADH-binding)